MMDLSQLASVLRENGDQVLNGLSKLSLSTKLLKDLNDSFALIIEERETLSSTFQVLSASNSKVELLLDLQFLHDFVQRTVGLKLVEDNAASCDLIAINKFKNLKLLEIRKVPLSQITGLQSLRAQLQYIICVRCLNDLKELFLTCGADKTQGFIWNELKEAVLSYNGLKTIDNSFEFVPWLQVLDLSHNFLTNAQPIDCLPNLKHLNIGFNYLETVPIFKKELFRNLQILILKSNYITDITGLIHLDNLVTLDLSCNYLVDHTKLCHLVHLAALQWLNLEGNPLSFVDDHRSATAQYLHPNTATVKFILDRVLLSKSEKKLIGTYFPIFTSSFETQRVIRRQHQSSVSSNVSDLTNSSEVTTIAASELTRSQSIQRGKRIRDAIISEKYENGDIRDDEGEIVNPELMKSVASNASLNLSIDHVETQKKIASLRKEYGEDWLKNQSGSIMQDILGMEKLEAPKQSTPYEQDFMMHAADVLKKPMEAVINSVAAIVSDEGQADAISDLSMNNTFVTASDGSMFEDGEMLESPEKASVCSDEELEDDEEHPFLAQILHDDKNPEEIFIVLTSKYIKERDSLSGRTRSKWLLEIIASCEILSTKPTTVRIEFDTVRRNMKLREYILEDEEAKKFYQEISNIISQRPLSEITQSVLCCMKCSTQFSWGNINTTIGSGHGTNIPKCPNPICGSTLVYEVDNDSTPTNRSLAQNVPGGNSDRAESPSECSIASETESKPLAQIHVIADVHMDSNSVAANCSAASVQESTEEESHSEHFLRKYESDIEVISNPSQSSIEVLDDQFRPGRKRSSEERRTIMAPTLVTIPDITTCAPLQGLTESSSSSSFTESVCTAYDTLTHTSRPSSGLGVRAVIQEEPQKEEKLKDEEKNKGNLISSLFEGLFAGPTTGTKSSKVDKIERSDSNEVKFHFSEDFTNVDHRVKYHLYENVFEDEHENFVWLLRCTLVSVNLKEPLEGCVVLSTYKVYVLQVKEHDNDDDLSTWLVKKESYTIDRLETVFTLPWKQGIGLEIRGAAKSIFNYLCVLQDMQRTSNFLTFLATNPLPDSCDLVCVPPERPMLNLQHLLLSHCTNTSPKDSSIILFSLFSKCVIASSESTSIQLGVFIVTSTELILLPDVTWLLPDADNEPKIFSSQPFSNLLEVDMEDTNLDFHFLDEVAGCEEVWTIQWETIDSLNTAISAVKTPWEEIFLVPFQVNHKVHSV